jgi:hypothetical protein
MPSGNPDHNTEKFYNIGSLKRVGFIWATSVHSNAEHLKSLSQLIDKASWSIDG